MNAKLLLAAFLLGCGLASAKRQQYQDEDGIYHLAFDDANDVIEGHKFAFVLFYAPWSQTSGEILFEFRETSKVFKDGNEDLVFGIVDLTDEQGLGMRFGVVEPPDFRIFHQGNPYFLDANRTRFGMIEALRRHMSPDWKAPESDKSHVLELTDKSFEEAIKREELIMVNFYAPWCNHCQQLMPAYEDAAKNLKELKPPIPMAKIDAVQYRELADAHGVKGYPTIKYYRKGKEQDYNGVRSAAGFYHFLKARSGAPSKELPAKYSDIKIFLEEREEDVVLGFFPEVGAYEYEVFDEIADDLKHDITFRHVFGGMEIAKKHFGVSSDDYAFVLLRNRRYLSKYDERFLVFEEDGVQAKTVGQWLFDNIRPLVGELSEPSTRGRYKTRPMVTVLFDLDWDRGARAVTQYTWNKVVEVAKDFRGQNLTFAIGDQESLAGLNDFFGLGDVNEDVLVAIWGVNNTRYPMYEEFSSDSFREHVQAFVDGKLKPYLRSLRPPKKNDGPVRIVVGSTFDKLVLSDRSKDIIVCFFAPWHDGSKRMDKVYRKVAKKFADNKEVLFVKYDGVNNDLPSGFDNSRDFPKIVMLKKGDERDDGPLSYSSEASVSELVEFVEENAVSLQEGKSEKKAEKKDEL